MTYLVISLLFLFVAFAFHVGAMVTLGIKKFALAVLSLLLAGASYIATVGFGVVWIIWLIKNI